MTARTLLVVVVSALLAGAQQKAPEKTQEKKDLCSVSGRVTNALTNEPARGARISLYNKLQNGTVYTVNSDADGKSLLENGARAVLPVVGEDWFRAFFFWQLLHA